MDIVPILLDDELISLLVLGDRENLQARAL
jgi:hypothetical protein